MRIIRMVQRYQSSMYYYIVVGVQLADVAESWRTARRPCHRTDMDISHYGERLPYVFAANICDQMVGNRFHTCTSETINQYINAIGLLI